MLLLMLLPEPSGRTDGRTDAPQEYVRHLNSVVQGEYRDRVIVVHPQLRLYTRALGVFDALKGKVEMTAPRFKVRREKMKGAKHSQLLVSRHDACAATHCA